MVEAPVEASSAERRLKIERAWLVLTRETMPNLASARNWPVRLDHCFQRILLDNVVGRPWRDAIAPPAYRNIGDALLESAIALGEAVMAGEADLDALNRRSLEWRGKLR